MGKRAGRKKGPPENVARDQVHVTKRTKQRILDLRGGGDFHEDVMVRLLDFWDENHGVVETNAEKESAD